MIEIDYLSQFQLSQYEEYIRGNVLTQIRIFVIMVRKYTLLVVRYSPYGAK